MTAFEAGKTYSCRSICDWNCVYTFKVVKRTAMMVTIAGGHRGTVARKVKIRDGVETLDPHGRYSMSPILRADHLEAA
jgi:hypothetical protein